MSISQKITRITALLCFISASSQETKKVLFLGNSYTHANNLPQTIADAAASVGKSLIFDMNAPGGYYLGQHTTNAVSLEKIAAGDWDHVVLQDQSLAMAYPGYFMNNLPASVTLDSIIKSHNPCAQTMYFATWGRKNGGTHLCNTPYCDPPEWIVRDYFAMDSDIESNYHFFADSLKASMAPVGAVWRYIRQNHPQIELFTPDESHPTMAGSYAAACCFYTVIFRSDPTLITYNSFIGAADAVLIRNAAKQVVYNHLLEWNVGLFDDLLDASCSLDRRENKKNTDWVIFPNPVDELLHVETPAFVGKKEILIYNSLGMLVKSVGREASFFAIDIRELPSGLYLLTVADTGQSYKFIKK